MTPPVSPYTNIITPRSRRYRTIMTVLLVFLLAMSVYGGFKVMPAVHQAVGKSDMRELRLIAEAQPSPGLTSEQILKAKRTLKKRSVVVYLAMAYWGVCSLMMVGILFLAWLDFRETTRSFSLQAQALRQETVTTLQQDSLRRQTGEDEDEEDV